MRPETWVALDERFARYPFLRAGAAGIEDVGDAERALGISFPEDYREFLLRHGGAIVGPYPVFGVRPVEAMGNEWSVVAVNKRYRADQWLGVEGWLVVSADHAGNPMGIDSGGRVWVSDHDFGGITAIADDFETFLLGKCLRLT